MERHLEKTDKTSEEVDAKAKGGGEGAGATAQPEIQEKPLEDLTETELIEKINALKGLSEKNYDLYVRSQAEMENMKKRFRREKEDWFKYSNETLIKEILPIMDNLERALCHATGETALPTLKEGVELTLRGLKTALGKCGLEEVKAEGETFDPGLHEAVFHADDDNAEPGKVVKEIQKGYLLNKRLIRPAMVSVSKRRPSETSEGSRGE
jgi:molecular chaperone GrpE